MAIQRFTKLVKLLYILTSAQFIEKFLFRNKIVKMHIK